MLLAELVAVSKRVAAVPARTAKVGLLAEIVTALDGAETSIGVSYLAGVVPQGSFGVGYASMRDLPHPAVKASLTILAVDQALAATAAITGAGSMMARQAEIDALFRRATGAEQEFLRALLVGGIRQGANEGIMMDAVARAFGVPAKLIRRAVMFTGDVGSVAAAARNGGRDAVAEIGLEVLRPVQPMLAKSASSIASALGKVGRAAIEHKIDGARIQVHRVGGNVRVFTRNLNDITARVPEIVAIASQLALESVVLDGEAIALRPDGKPSPFQETMGRFGSEADDHEIRLTPYFFDILHLDGADTLDLTLHQRIDLLDRVVPEEFRVPRLVTAEAAEGDVFFAQTIAAGHEGVVVKALDTTYEAGRRGPGWLKIKPVHTLDLVVLAVEWGSGRRQGWLSNIHLGARSDTGFVMVGKTFKGMTDAILEWQTQRFLELETHRKGHVVHVLPEQVVEIGLDGVQRSTRYPGGVALRFARVRGYRDDKTAAEADTIEAIQAMLT